jgi:hypothetical protein
VLGQHARSQDHLDAGRDLLQDLCNSIRGFGHVGLPQLLGPAEPMPIDPYRDRAWLSDVAFNLHDLLIRCDMVWPPPEQQDRPAIVRDLQSMYDRLAFRHKYLSPINAETLMAVVSLIGGKACKLADSPGWFLFSTDPRHSKRKVRKITKLTGSLAIVATVIGVLQAPETINHFPQEWGVFKRSIERVATMAANDVVDLSKEIRGRSFVSLIPNDFTDLSSKAPKSERQPRNKPPIILG